MLKEISADLPIVLMITIFSRKYEERISKLFSDEGVTFNLLTLGRGTANSRIASYLGLGETEKAILFSIAPLKKSKVLLEKLGGGASLDRPGHGIAATLPVDSICGTSEEKCLYNLSRTEDGANNMEEDVQHDLIIAVTNRGFSGEVMEAAKAAKATGGTVIHARGTGLKEAEKFFGVSIQPEKEIVMILARSELKSGIMESILSRAGPQSEARTFVFSLPVNGVARISDPLPDRE